jgi:ornithine cyclodeaminase/alanine dehydrogenase-like protein (mu-crystallin family)
MFNTHRVADVSKRDHMAAGTDSSDIKQLLRLADEPCVYIGEMQAHDVMMDGCCEFMDLLRDFYVAWGSDAIDVTLPLKQVYVDDEVKGDFRLMPCIMKQSALKFVKVIGTNEEELTVKDKICVGKSLLIDYYDNHVYAILDVCALSSFRTAAVSVLAFNFSGPQPEGVGIVGLGRIGFYTAYILHHWLGVNSFVVSDTEERSCDNFTSLTEQYLPNVSFELLPTDEAIAVSRALFVATTSDRSLVHSANGAHLQFISSVGADADNLSELDESLLDTHDVLTDSTQSMCLGDMKRWLQNGTLNSDDVTELKTVVRERDTSRGKVLFISTGIAVQDVLVNRFVYEKLKQP